MGIRRDEWFELMKNYRLNALLNEKNAPSPTDAEYWSRVAHRLDEEIKYFEKKIFF